MLKKGTNTTYIWKFEKISFLRKYQLKSQWFRFYFVLKSISCQLKGKFTPWNHFCIKILRISNFLMWILILNLVSFSQKKSPMQNFWTCCRRRRRLHVFDVKILHHHKMRSTCVCTHEKLYEEWAVLLIVHFLRDAVSKLVISVHCTLVSVKVRRRLCKLLGKLKNL